MPRVLQLSAGFFFAASLSLSCSDSSNSKNTANQVPPTNADGTSGGLPGAGGMSTPWNMSGGSFSATGGAVNTGGAAAHSGGESSGGATSGGSGDRPLGPLTDLFVQGINYPETNNGEWEFYRLSFTLRDMGGGGFNVDNARTTPGAALVFETTSPSVTVNFRYNADDVQRYGVFGVSQNGGEYETTNSPASDTATTLSISSESPGQLVRYQVVLPPWSNAILTDIELDDGHQLEEFNAPNRKAYVALGDSITHGVGQNATYQGYAWQIAEAFDFELFNLAVGGSIISLPIADSLSDWDDLGLVTVLIGYNDWMYQGKTVQQYKEAYANLLDTVRTHHPDVPIVCLNMLDSKNTISNRSGIAMSDFRAVISEVVTERQQQGDANVYFAPANEWTNTTSDLADAIHLSPAGAAKLATELGSYIGGNVNL